MSQVGIKQRLWFVLAYRAENSHTVLINACVKKAPALTVVADHGGSVQTRRKGADAICDQSMPFLPAGLTGIRE